MGRRRPPSASVTPGLPQTPGVVRIRGRLLTVYNKKFQRYVAKKWQQGNGGPTPDRNLAKDSFKQSVALIKSSVDSDMIASIELAAGTPFLPRDLRMKATFGTLIVAQMRDGRVVSGGRAVPVNASDLLDQLADTVGAILQRNADQWRPIPIPSTDGWVLTFNNTTKLWEARALPVTPSSGNESIAAWVDTPALPGFDPKMIYKTTQTLSSSNRTITPASGTPYNWAFGTPAQFKGKKYFEAVPGSTSFSRWGICSGGGHQTDAGNVSLDNFGLAAIGQISWGSDGTFKCRPNAGNGTIITIGTIATWAATNRLCFAVDIDNELIWMRVGSGNWNNSGSADPATGVGGLTITPVWNGASNRLLWPGCNNGNTAASSLYLKSADFAQAVPSGYAAWGNS